MRQKILSAKIDQAVRIKPGTQTCQTIAVCHTCQKLSSPEWATLLVGGANHLATRLLIQQTVVCHQNPLLGSTRKILLQY